jgi:protein gp37
MNRQGSKKNPTGGIEWTHILGPYTGRTSNPIRGCQHACRWRMPDGKLAICYAEATAIRFPGKHYEKGFGTITFDSRELLAIRSLKTPAGIFIDSMSDLFGKNVPREWIDLVIQTILDCPRHVFFSLTKNPARFRDFAGTWPPNWLVGISAPPTFMFGHELSLDQQIAWFTRGLEFLRDSPAAKRWVSLEPLSFDVSKVLEEADCPLDWAVIGAASNGAETFQPTEKNLVQALKVLAEKKTPLFFKGNLNRSFVKICGSEWREEFPKL